MIGRFVGFSPSPSTAAASGIWSVDDVAKYRGLEEWPSGGTIAAPRTLHLTNSVDTSWETLGNWWNDSSFTSPASSLPTAADEVHVYAFMSASAPQSVWSLVGESGGILTYMTLAVAGGAVFKAGSAFYDSAVLNGNAVFNGNSENYGTINGNATFNDTSKNYGSVTGTKTCNTTSGFC